MATTNKKTTKKKAAKKKTTKKASSSTTAPKTSSKKKATKKATGKTKKGGKASSPLLQARELLKGAFKSTEWQTDLDPRRAKQAQEVLSTNSVVINALISGPVNEYGVTPCPGLPKGRITNLYGKEGSGKTTLALEVSAETIRKGGTVCYIDWEHEIVPSYAMSLGVPIGDDSKFMLCQPDTLEEGIAILYTMVSAGVDLVVLDSVGAGVPKAYFDKAIKDTAEGARLGLNAATWSQFLPKLKARINKTRSTIIGISQIRDAINTMGYGDNFTVQGGKAWKFYSALRIRLQPIGQEKASEYSAVVNKSADRVVGSRIKAKLDKCKVSPQQNNETVFYIRYGEGIDDLRSLIEIGIAHKLIKKSGSWFEWLDPDGESVRFQGMEKFRGAFSTDPKKHRLLEKQVLPYLGAASSTTGEEEDDDLFGDDTFQDDEDLKEILTSINKTTSDEED
jgi:recombination protein RecA